MKLLKSTSLYFFICFILFFNNGSNAQQKNDSLQYYYNLLYDRADENLDLKKTYTFFNKRKELSLQQKDTIRIIFYLRVLATIEHRFGNLHKSDATAISALELVKSMKNSSEMIEPKTGIFNLLGIISYELGNYDRALEIYDRALEIADNPQLINTIQNNKANAYIEKKQYQLSIDEFEKIHQNSLKFDDKMAIARSLDNLGFAKSKLHKKDALVDMLAALKIREQEQNIGELITSYRHLSMYFITIKNLKKAEYYANKAYLLAVKSKNPNFKLVTLSLLLNSKNDVKVRMFKKLNDSINAAKQKNDNLFASIQYDYIEEKRKADEAKLKISEIQLQEEKQKRLKTIYLGLGSFVTLCSIFLYYILKARHKKDKLLEVYKTETRISKKVHDEVANDVYHIMTKMQGDTLIKDDLLDDLEDIYIKTREISKENSAIDVNENFENFLNDLLVSYKSDDINIITKNISKIDWSQISIEQKTAIYRILQELMTNMKKHSKASIVVFTFLQDEKLTINYSDNGVGCILKKHVGLQNAENRIQSIEGIITFESKPNDGFKAKIIV